MQMIQVGGFATFIALIAAYGVSAAVPDDPTKVVPAAVGSMAPAFNAVEVDGKQFHFDPAHLHAPAMIIFFRGGWCPYCNAHLQDLRTVEPEIVAMGYHVLFLSTDRPDLLYSSLKEKVNYHILSDSSLEAARAFGVAYRIDAEAFKKMRDFGVDLEKTQGTDSHELPVPSVFIVDRSGVVRFRYFDPDFRVRLDAASVLRAAQKAPHEH
jgi:peroxiredoxin